MLSMRLFACALAYGFVGHAYAQLTVRSGSGADAAALTPTRDLFRADLGGGTVAGANGSFGGVRREVNWDGVPSTSAAPNNLPANFFNVNSPRGMVLSTPGSGFQVSASTSDASGQPLYFGNIDPSYSATFTVFTPQRLFTPVGSNIYDVTFYIPGTTTPAAVNGFGVVFTDVDQANTTSVRLFDRNSAILGTYYAPVASGGLSFVGAFTNDGLATIARARVTLGNAFLFPGVFDNNTSTDLVVTDDFIYGEPTDRIFGDGFD
jgi:hypothetical protein